VKQLPKTLAFYCNFRKIAQRKKIAQLAKISAILVALLLTEVDRNEFVNKISRLYLVIRLLVSTG
jgi:hypothetical protein